MHTLMENASGSKCTTWQIKVSPFTLFARLPMMLTPPETLDGLWGRASIQERDRNAGINYLSWKYEGSRGFRELAVPSVICLLLDTNISASTKRTQDPSFQMEMYSSL